MNQKWRTDGNRTLVSHIPKTDALENEHTSNVVYFEILVICIISDERDLICTVAKFIEFTKPTRHIVYLNKSCPKAGGLYFYVLKIGWQLKCIQYINTNVYN